MELTRESPRVRWLALGAAWAVFAVLIALHSAAVRDYVEILNGLGLRGATEAGTPLQRVVLPLYADTQMWVRHALSLLETDAWRVRFTEVDNAPFGRPVHWSSAFAWLVAGQGWLRHVFTGEPLPLAVERSLAWFNLPLLLAIAIPLSIWTSRRAGAGAGIFVGFALIGHSEFYIGFAPNFADHHGVLSAAVFGVVLGVMFMGAGWHNPGGKTVSALLPATGPAARRAAIVSALSGAVGMWVSAASVIPGIAIAGASAVAVLCWQGRALQRAGAVFDPGLWRLWGRVGAGASLLFYLLEYAPNHFSLRLEVNHPLYAAGWWGAAELIAEFGARWLGPADQRWRMPARLVLPIVAVGLPAATLLLGGTKVFIVRDPWIHQLAARVSEGLSLSAAMRIIGPEVLTLRLPWLLTALLPAGYLMIRGRATDRLVLGYTFAATLLFFGMAVGQIRFFANTGPSQVCAVLAAMVAVSATWKNAWRWTLAVAVTAILCLPSRVERIIEARAAVAAREVTRLDVLQTVYRDIAKTLRAGQPSGDIVLLTNPDASTGIGYYGRLKTVGTLFWENLEGVKAAAAMFAVKSLPEARELYLRRSITHVAMISESSFVTEYFQLAQPNAGPDEWQQSFAFQLFRRQAPLWLEELPYEPPPDTKYEGLEVALYRTRFAAPAAEEAFMQATAKVAARDIPGAEQLVDRAIALDRTGAEFWLLKSELLMARGALDASYAALETSLSHLPLLHRATLARVAGNSFYPRGAQAAAAKLYRESLALRYDASAASNLAWLMATSADGSLRDPANALALGERVAREDPSSYQFVSTYAAALAENGRFADAVAVATKAVELARATGDAMSLANAEARLKAYQARQAWRQ